MFHTPHACHPVPNQHQFPFHLSPLLTVMFVIFMSLIFNLCQQGTIYIIMCYIT
ncbi:hypothetical protein KNP414_00660 [Paenibacillus mucilaginosus KNP414]|uniref:Uncharacterized protein n=1 Tax=Paenibacillus mucilaginosus (strain KNP414) TaxID=1036673 RepID=F8FQS9_PAEMK|nr:hypothetical protein KNP414_00660 [Paenibacillus mucilaginosus KNP414]